MFDQKVKKLWLAEFENSIKVKWSIKSSLWMLCCVIKVQKNLERWKLAIFWVKRSSLSVYLQKMCGTNHFFFLLFDVCMIKSLLALTRLFHICLTELMMKMRSSDTAIGQQAQIKLVSIRLKSCSLWSTLGRDVRCVDGCPDWLLTLILLNKTELLSNLLPQSLPHPPVSLASPWGRGFNPSGLRCKLGESRDGWLDLSLPE